jgi:hypothetical protein
MSKLLFIYNCENILKPLWGYRCLKSRWIALLSEDDAVFLGKASFHAKERQRLFIPGNHGALI